MKPDDVKPFCRPRAANLASSTVSIGIASTFVLATSALSLVADRPAPPDSIGGGWMLRGALTPADPAPTGPSAHAATPGNRQLG